MAAEGHQDGGKETPGDESHRVEADEDGGKGKAGKEGVGEGVGNKSQTPQHNKRPHETIGKTDHETRQQRTPHELVFERFKQPIHDGRPENTGVEKALRTASSVKASGVGP